ncbi:Uncharacterised protein [uncultured Roseburia sp.]|uniref:DUF4430 domain-containing protein n=1 Tax=Brotonthovivens ammoniilytica TaxID=2981725 RepID=A0ABT2TKD3_9FIRM|nr:DUF4430 domain-containing protein [Brotonthovivens ammoniilytica]MCU6762621.1 DUF4430 domain-containing protein [Brotonthovivens ammoniilytica]SCI77611.1 Uncharacterised protein [uncultured Roseburia sp.]
MDKDFEKKVKGKKRRNIALTAVILAAAAVCILVPLLQKGRDGRPVEVSLEIRCDELSEDMSKLKDKNLTEYVPEDGTILKKETVQTTSGSTVLDVLDEVCREKNIQIEYSYTPGYDSYYVEGINYLYEFDGGRLSGWSYTVDGESPRVGCSKYQLKGGEEIVWNYTCGLPKGADGGKSDE